MNSHFPAQNPSAAFPTVNYGNVAGESRPVVNARDLHAFLNVGRDFATWIKDRLAEYGFIEGEDFAKFDSPKSGNQKSRGGDRRSVDYHLTLDTAKELAMAEKTEQGREVRRYFIRCEREVLSAARPVPLPAIAPGILPPDFDERLGRFLTRHDQVTLRQIARETLGLDDLPPALGQAIGKRMAQRPHWHRRRNGSGHRTWVYVYEAPQLPAFSVPSKSPAVPARTRVLLTLENGAVVESRTLGEGDQVLSGDALWDLWNGLTEDLAKPVRRLSGLCDEGALFRWKQSSLS